MNIAKSIPEHWQLKKLGEVCKILNGKNQKDVVNPNGKYPIYGSAGIIGYSDHFLCEAGTTIVGRKGTINRPIYVNSRFWNVDTAFGFSPFSELLDGKFLFFFCQGFNFHKLDKSTTIPSLAKTDLLRIEIPLPPLPEQRAIVAKIEELFSELENGQQQLLKAQEQLKVYRQSLLKAAFEGKLTNKDVKEGELPEGWKLSTIGDIFEVFIGSTPKRNTPEYWGGDINWLSSGEIAFCSIKNTKEKITQEGLKNSACKVHPKGTVIIAMIGEGKTRGQAAVLEIPAAHNQNTAAIRVNETIYSSMLLYYYLVLKYEENRKVGSGNNQKALNKERVKNIQIPLPPFSEQQHIVSELESKLTVCDKIEETISQGLLQAESLRQSILKKAFEGELV